MAAAAEAAPGKGSAGYTGGAPIIIGFMCGCNAAQVPACSLMASQMSALWTVEATAVYRCP